MTFYFAWVNAETTIWNSALKRHDENVFSFDLSQSEGDFATLSIEIKNPRRGFLSPERDVWAWLTKNDTPLFFGRLIAIPEELSSEIVRLLFVAQPRNFQEQKIALANSLKVFPFYDPVWLNEDQTNNPDVVLEARSQLWHIDRLTHEVTVSDILTGEDGVVEMLNLFYDSLDISYGSVPLRRVRVEAEVSWNQIAFGTVDLTKELIKAFTLAGSTIKVNNQDVSSGRISSFTGQGLEEDWPEQFDNLNGGWTIGEQILLRVDGKAVQSRYRDVVIQPHVTIEKSTVQVATGASFRARFFLWEFVPTYKLDYDVSRQKIEYLTFELETDTQPLLTEPGDQIYELVTLQSQRVSEHIDANESRPIGQLNSRGYFITDRGRKSFQYLLMLARAKLLLAARSVEVTAMWEFDFGSQLSCRKNLLIVDPRIPGGQAFGKIINYSLIATGDGKQFCQVTIGCAIGEGNVVEGVTGDPSYAVGDWDDDYQFYIGANLAVSPLVGEITYNDFSDTEIIDDNVNFDDIDMESLIKTFEVINGQTIQHEILKQKFGDIPQVIETLNANFTEVLLELEPLDGGPFETTYNVLVSNLMIPKHIDLGS